MKGLVSTIDIRGQNTSKALQWQHDLIMNHVNAAVLAVSFGKKAGRLY